MSQPKIVADFSTQLTTNIAVGGTTATLNSNVDDDGVTLQDGYYFFTIDGNNASKEHISCTKTGTALTAIKTVSRQGAETSGVLRAHRVGALVVMTDFATYKYYMDNGFASGTVDSSTTAKGVGKLSVAPAGADPIFVGDNDTRVPTQGENDGLAATTTPSSSNKFITQKDLQIGAEVYAADSQASDTYVITLSPAPASYVTGMEFTFKANTVNTGAATLNVNALGAKTIKKSYNVDLSDGDIKANQIVKVVYDGTNFQMVSPISGNSITSGVTTHDLSSTTTQNIAHGLGATPRHVKLTATYNNQPGSASQIKSSTVFSVYSGSTFSAMYNNYITGDGANGSTGTVGNVARISIDGTNGSYEDFSITTDSTNIIITWGKAGTPTGTAYLLWEAYV